MSPKSKTFIRHLGHLESYQSAMHNIGHYCGTVVACRYSLPPSLRGSKMLKETMKRFDAAIAQTVIQFPLLQVGLVGESTKKPFWVPLSSVDLANHITWDVRPDLADYDLSFAANLQYQLDAKFECLESRPGWRMLLMRTEIDGFVDAMFVWNHANCDGISAKIFHRALLKSLSEPSSSTPLAPGSRVMSTDISKDGFPQPPERLAKHRVTLGFAISEVWHNFGPSVFLSSISKARWAPVQTTPYATRSKCIDINPVTLKRLLGVCRQHETTLTGLLHGIVLMCLSVDLPEGKANAFSVTTAMDQRRFMRLENRPSKYASLDPQSSVQNCAAAVYHAFNQDIISDIRAQARNNNLSSQPISDLEPSIWKAAKIVRSDIEDRLRLGLTDNVVGLMKVVTDWHDYHKSKEKKPRELSWNVTNIGVIDCKPEVNASEEGAWSVAKARFTFSVDVTGPAIQISAVSVKEGDFSIEISWQDLDERKYVCNRLVRNMEAWLVYLGA